MMVGGAGSFFFSLLGFDSVGIISLKSADKRALLIVPVDIKVLISSLASTVAPPML
jgi:hypothetical protein